VKRKLIHSGFNALAGEQGFVGSAIPVRNLGFDKPTFAIPESVQFDN
jgi:hypothetical protein